MKTNSRYDFMESSKVKDEISGVEYPDPLSLNYLNFEIDELPPAIEMNNFNLSYFWKTAENFYGMPCWDDMVLTLNGVAHKNLLNTGDTVYFPTLDSIYKSFNKER